MCTFNRQSRLWRHLHEFKKKFDGITERRENDLYKKKVCRRAADRDAHERGKVFRRWPSTKSYLFNIFAVETTLLTLFSKNIYIHTFHFFTCETINVGMNQNFVCLPPTAISFQRHESLLFIEFSISFTLGLVFS